MKVLALDTATERCSVALWCDGQLLERCEDTARAQAELVLPMVSDVLREAGIGLRQLSGIAFGRGPGGFTGVRVAVSVAQGLAFAAGLPVVGISNLAAVAQQVAGPHDEVLVCMDARMGEVYCGRFTLAAGAALVTVAGDESVRSPAAVELRGATLLAGTGFSAYPGLAARWPDLPQRVVLPHARQIAVLGMAELAAGKGLPAEQAQPVYLRDEVAQKKVGSRESGAGSTEKKS
jgi:tRNA threonylcarbamoyladenosine biosynthesis protein TsaB